MTAATASVEEIRSAFSGGREYSDATAAQLDREVKSILEQREAHVTRLLTEHNEALVKVAERLIKKEMSTEKEFRDLLEVPEVDATAA